VNPDKLASLGVTVSDISNAVKAQNKVNPAGQVGGEPVPLGQQFTYNVRAPGRLPTAEEFGEIVVRAQSDGSILRLKDVARVELGSQYYFYISRLGVAGENKPSQPAALLALYLTPGSNALQTRAAVLKMMDEAKGRFPQGLDYITALDTTLAVSAGIHEIYKTLGEALVLVIIVVYIFLQGFRATLIPLLAVPVSLIATFMVFPMLGFSINTLSLLGMVLAIGLVVDDAIVVVEAVEHNIELGLTPHDATIKAMEEVSGPVIAIALILAAVFVPTAFIPGITGQLYKQFAITIAISVLFSAFNALTLSPALSAMCASQEARCEDPSVASFAGSTGLWPRHRRLREHMQTTDPQGRHRVSFLQCSPWVRVTSENSSREVFSPMKTRDTSMLAGNCLTRRLCNSPRRPRAKSRRS
jgi:HAE1 family hydrophobic/amphiphilic exporter-1